MSFPRARVLPGRLFHGASSPLFLHLHMMCPDGVCKFLLQQNDVKVDIDTSISCVYILLNILSFGVNEWMDESISPSDVLQEVRNVMFLWDVTAKRTGAYRSLLPIFRLLECQAVPKEESQYVAAWILCNLTTVDADEYCDMLRRGNGEEIIRRVYISLGEDRKKTKNCSMTSSLI
ncbi:hypothetical protein CHS0354_028311 [Potamilus streckersoni]|uniref:Protein zer-1 homolog-like C-terminal domain-containing protein n=1 Tax=Potamilus streckersoni TaxID=2493646 RepID=A0AAE0RTR3_9BIVA|nr:hypothetical protein CHS0354_028311 [Potamilus streckersoni]